MTSFAQLLESEGKLFLPFRSLSGLNLGLFLSNYWIIFSINFYIVVGGLEKVFNSWKLFIGVLRPNFNMWAVKFDFAIHTHLREEVGKIFRENSFFYLTVQIVLVVQLSLNALVYFDSLGPTLPVYFQLLLGYWELVVLLVLFLLSVDLLLLGVLEGYHWPVVHFALELNLVLK